MADEPNRPRYKRSARNYLLDKHFQLKYTGFLVAIAVVLSGVLGTLLWQASDEVLAQTRDTVQQGKEAVKQGQATVEQSQQTIEQGKATVKKGRETVDRGKDTIKLSDNLNKLVSSTIETCYKDNEDLLKSFKQSVAEDDARLQKEQQQLEDDQKALETDQKRLQEGNERNVEENKRLEERTQKLEAESARAEKRQGTLKLGLTVVLLALVGAIGFAGIIFTHKIAGPIFKMKRLFRQVGEGKLVLREKLRKGDELQHFFEAFEKMVLQLRDRQVTEIGQVDAILEKLEAEGVKDDSKSIEALKALRAEMQDHIE